MHEPTLLLDLWRSLPRDAGNLLPRRADMSIAMVAPVLPNCWQMRWYGGERYVLEFMGERLTGTWGRDMSGSDIFALVTDGEAAQMRAMISPIFAQPCGLSVSRRISKGEGGEYELANWSVPMLDGDGAPTVVFGMSRITRHQQETPYSGKLMFRGSRISEARYIDLGHGTPGDVPALASA